MFQKNFGQIFALGVQEEAPKLPFEAEKIHITVFACSPKGSHIISHRNFFISF